MLSPDPRFGSQDFQPAQPCRTLTYARALQCWVERAHLPITSEPHHLEESMVELHQVVELLVSFMDEEVFVATVPYN